MANHPMSFARARAVAVVGSGTAGLFAALALKAVRPTMRVAIVASRAIPVIGVGEATTPPIVAFLHGFLGIDPAALYAAVRPTWKLGIRFEWGTDAFHYAFGGGDLGAAQVHDGHIRDYSFVSRLMTEGRGLVQRTADGLRSHLGQHRFAYHLDNAPFVAFLEDVAAARGIERIEGTVVDALRDEVGGIETLRLEDGRELRFDAWVDASGFRSQLLGGCLGTRFEPYDSSLYCDMAVVGNSPASAPEPFTRATTMPSGWCWTIPMETEDHHGYVFASAFCDPADAECQLRARFGVAGETRVVRFRSGRRTDLVVGNVAAIGNAYGFVEPLESTALHMTIATALRIAALATGASDDAAAVSREVGEQWDYLRGFLAVHYRFNDRIDSPFWRHCRENVDLAVMARALEDYRTGPLFTQRPLPPYVRDTVFGARGLDLLLLGQSVLPGTLVPEVAEGPWRARQRGWDALLPTMLPHADALGACAKDAQLLVANGWIATMAEAMRAGAGSY